MSANYAIGLSAIPSSQRKTCCRKKSGSSQQIRGFFSFFFFFFLGLKTFRSLSRKKERESDVFAAKESCVRHQLQMSPRVPRDQSSPCCQWEGEVALLVPDLKARFVRLNVVRFRRSCLSCNYLLSLSNVTQVLRENIHLQQLARRVGRTRD